MPYVRRRSIRRRRKAYRPVVTRRSRTVGRRYTGRKVAIPRVPFRSKWKNPLATGALLKFKYADSDFNMSTTVGVSYVTINTFSGNSLFDPDVTGVGVQPYGYDPLASLYGSYNVIGSKIKVRFYTAESPVYKAICSVIPSVDDVLDYYDPNDLRVTAKAKQRIISSTEGLTRSHFISHYCTTKRLFPGETSRDVNFTALWTASPARRWYWLTYVDTSDQATEDSIYMDVQITYYAIVHKTTNNNES